MKDTNESTGDLLRAILDDMPLKEQIEWVIDVIQQGEGIHEWLLTNEDEGLIYEVAQEKAPHLFFEVDDPDRGYDEWRDMRDERAAED
jgi:hypothetical protein